MKKIKTMLLIYAVLSLFVLFSSFTFAKVDFISHVFFEGENVCTMSFTMPYKMKFQLFVSYSNNIQKYYENNYYGNQVEFLSYLNTNFLDDYDNLEKMVFIEANNAKTEYLNSGKFSYEKEKSGRCLDSDSFLTDLIKNLGKDSIISLPTKEILPDITESALRKATVKIADFSTDYHNSSLGRKHNVALAVNRLNGLTVSPQTTASFNNIVGERTLENGFKNAKIIFNGEFVEGIGGGVCQVSTTLYNAWVLSGLAIERSSTHSLPVSYVAPSLDAMVSSSSDLILKNDGEYPVYVNMRCDGNRIFTEIYGFKSEFDIVLRSETLKVLNGEDYIVVCDEEIPDGTPFCYEIEKPAKNGLISEAYRDYYKNGICIFSEKLRRSVYSPQKGIKRKKILIAEE